ncbi:MAG TPA: sugar transferase [Thermoleophilaceae bacterium]|nr:sugar transferase [Thermoleophilaceae bacterium]
MSSGEATAKPDRGVLTSRSSARLIRAFDLAVAVVMLPPALLVGAIIAVIIFVDSPGPIFYHSRRIGKGGEAFDMLKFRKMRRDATGAPLTKHRDERLTPIGEFLVATKLDELPQLWNVLRGQMSIVGPRPEVAEFVSMYADEYREILSVVPGITGPAQLEYIEERHLLADAHESSQLYAEEILPRKIAVDLDYIRTQSLRRDLAILAHTALMPARTLREPLSLAAARARRERARMALGGLAVAAVVALLVAFVVTAGPVR